MVGRAVLNPLDYRPAVRALFRALDRWVADDAPLTFLCSGLIRKRQA
jgi:hypothetical protein